MRPITAAEKKAALDRIGDVVLHLDPGLATHCRSLPPVGKMRDWLAEASARPAGPACPPDGMPSWPLPSGKAASGPQGDSAGNILRRAREMAWSNVGPGDRMLAEVSSYVAVMDSVAAAGKGFGSDGRKGLPGFGYAARSHGKAGLRGKVLPLDVGSGETSWPKTGSVQAITCQADRAYLAAMVAARRRNYPGQVWIRMLSAPHADTVVPLASDAGGEEARKTIQDAVSRLCRPGFGEPAFMVNVLPWLGFRQVWHTVAKDGLHHTVPARTNAPVEPGAAPSDEDVEAVLQACDLRPGTPGFATWAVSDSGDLAVTSVSTAFPLWQGVDILPIFAVLASPHTGEDDEVGRILDVLGPDKARELVIRQMEARKRGREAREAELANRREYRMGCRPRDSSGTEGGQA